MGFVELFTANRIWIEFIYAFIIVGANLVIYFKSRKFYNLSGHKGIKYFSNAFLFFAIAFSIRFVFWLVLLIQNGTILLLHPHAEPGSLLSELIFIAFEYTISLAGFYLVFSLVYKQVERFSKSIFIQKGYILHIIAIIITVLDYIFSRNVHYFMFITQIILYAYAINKSYSNYRTAQQHEKCNFLQLYFIAMILVFIGWFTNFLRPFLVPLYPPFILYIYAITASIFLIFLYGVIRVCTCKQWQKREST